MSDLGEKVKTSIERIKAFEPNNGEGYYLAFSGGKDSVALKALMDMAGVKYDATYRVTSVDPPELVQFIRDKHPDVNREMPTYPTGDPMEGKQITMWNLIPRKLLPPTRLVRYCCSSLKETGGDGRMTVTGVRWAESYARRQNQGVVTIASKKVAKQLGDDINFSLTSKGGVVLTNDNDDARRVIESCYKRHKTVLNPIIEWEDDDVWEFIKAENVPYCCLYDEGRKRLGCIGCPMAGKHGREEEFARWPKYQRLYLQAFAKLIEVRKERHDEDPSLPVWKRADGAEVPNPTPMDVFNWWMEYDVIPGQIDIFELLRSSDEYPSDE